MIDKQLSSKSNCEHSFDFKGVAIKTDCHDIFNVFKCRHCGMEIYEPVR